jgi:hypothetical protein
MVGGARWRLGPDAAADELRLNFALGFLVTVQLFSWEKSRFLGDVHHLGVEPLPLRCNLVSVCIPQVGTGNECVVHLVGAETVASGGPHPQWGQPGATIWPVPTICIVVL